MKKRKKQLQLVVCFGDGETWSCADDVQLLVLGPTQFKKLEAGDYPKHLKGKVAYNLMDLLKRLERADALLRDQGMASGEQIISDEKAYREQYTVPFTLV